ncbi:hypothetical protein [Hirschia maritima]|uniref:hypothetical protein n=1 Tax=Hirschia maritima TaxID=1121961 RepID=UPI000380FD8E|nr:hypothetical protein [Hirschia maritima]
MSTETFSWLEGIIAAGALVTSAAAVYIAWDQAETMRVEQHASVFPAIQIDPYNTHENGSGLQLGWSVENAGVGPAFIRSARLYDADTALTGYEELNSILPTGADIQFKQLTGRVIAPGISKDALTLSWRSLVIPRETVDRAYSSTADWTLEICYCSTYDHCWTSTSNQRTHAKRVESCTTYDDGLF